LNTSKTTPIGSSPCWCYFKKNHALPAPLFNSNLLPQQIDLKYIKGTGFITLGSSQNITAATAHGYHFLIHQLEQSIIDFLALNWRA